MQAKKQRSDRLIPDNPIMLRVLLEWGFPTALKEGDKYVPHFQQQNANV